MKLFVGFDINNKNIKILQAEKMTVEAPVEYLHFTERIFTKEFYEEARGLLADYFERKPSAKNLQAYVVLPNEAVGTEIFNVPNMAITKQIPALDAELVNLYGNKRKDKKINRAQLMKTKQYTVFELIYFDRKMIGDINNLLTEVKVFPKATTFCGNALLNSVYAYMPKARGKSFVFADIRLDYTLVAVSSKGKTLGVATFRHGTDLLKRDKVELEYMRTNHEAGEIAVINAREMAKAKALTRAGEEIDLSVIPEDATLEDYAVEGAAEGEYSGVAMEEVAVDEVTGTVEQGGENGGESAENAPKEQAEKPQTTPKEGEAAAATKEGETADKPATSEDTAPKEGEPAAVKEGDAVNPPEGQEGDMDGDEFFESEEDEAKRLAEIAAQKLKKQKTYRKMPKRYPKFMMREQPTTEEEFLYENFRIIQKWILSYARQAQLTEYIQNPEYILVNMPHDLIWLLDRANEDMGDDGIKFRPFAAAEKLPSDIASNLDLVGCMFSNLYNKHNNF